MILVGYQQHLIAVCSEHLRQIFFRNSVHDLFSIFLAIQGYLAGECHQRMNTGVTMPGYVVYELVSILW